MFYDIEETEYRIEYCEDCSGSFLDTYCEEIQDEACNLHRHFFGLVELGLI
tara:strand:+ start:217 stop:369 length:153 start_codon:yes stop_codon:yes gene_type:complete